MKRRRGDKNEKGMQEQLNSRVTSESERKAVSVESVRPAQGEEGELINHLVIKDP